MLQNYQQFRQQIVRTFHKCENLKHTSSLHGAVGPNDEALYTDYFYTPEKKKRCLIHISGVHGVEGYIGSHIQNQILQNYAEKNFSMPDDMQLVVVHVVNPFGMAWYHRTNEENVDLNRNSVENYDIKNPLFRSWVPLFASSSDLAINLQSLKMLPSVIWHGKDKLFRAIANGQSEFPESLFYSGKKLQFELRSLLTHLQQIISADADLYVLDVHTGLGQFKQESLLLDGFDSEQDQIFFNSAFNSQVIHPLTTPGYYRAEGTLSLLLKRHWGATRVHHIYQEFGTYDFKYVIRQLIRDQHFKTRSAQSMLETYFPNNDDWCNSCSELGLKRFSQLLK